MQRAAADRFAATDPPTRGSSDPEPAWGLAGAAIGLALAGVLAPVGVAAAAMTGALSPQPLILGGLVAMLVLGPAGVGVAAVVFGPRRIAVRAAQTGHEAEQAVCRVLVVAALFGYALALSPFSAAMADCVPLVAAWLAAAWAVVFSIPLWPGVAPWRRPVATALDLVLLSGFLHLGGDTAAGCYPLYLVAIFYAGARFGLAALTAAAVLSLLGFVAVVATTAAWRQAPVLAAGLLAALAALPALFAGALRSAEAARAAATEAETERQQTLLLIADSLRAPAASAATGSSVKDVSDFAALEAGTFAAPVETFDLRLLARRSLGPLQSGAARRGGMLRWRIDPRLPYRLRGHAQALGRILSGLAEHAAGAAPNGHVRIAIDGAAAPGGRITLRLRISRMAGPSRSGATAGHASLALRLAERLIALMSGTLASDRYGPHARLTVSLPLDVELGPPGPMLDLCRRPVLLVTEDDDLARALAEPLAAWNAEAQWPGDADAALATVTQPTETQRPIMIVDGRNRLLSALGLAHQAARLGGRAPFLLLIADEAQIASLGDVDDGELDGFIPAPVTEQLLALAVHGLPLEPLPQTRPAEAPIRPSPRKSAAEPPSNVAAPPAQPDRITPIAAHPRFAADTAGAIDSRVIARLDALGGGPSFVRDVIETFRTDAGEIRQRLEEAAATADPAAFRRNLVALQRAAGHLGGAQLCELAASLQLLSAEDLRQHGTVHMQRLAAEIDRLGAALAEFVPAAEGGRS